MFAYNFWTKKGVLTRGKNKRKKDEHLMPRCWGKKCGSRGGGDDRKRVKTFNRRSWTVYSATERERCCTIYNRTFYRRLRR